MNSLPINLELKDNIIPGVDNEIITVQKDNTWTPCYRVISKGNHFNRLKGQYRTFQIDIDKDVYVELLPPRVVIFASSLENSFGYENELLFFNQNPHITEISLNHHVSVSYKPNKIEYLKEKHTNCEEESFYEVFEKVFASKAKESCQSPCLPHPYHLPKNIFDFCDFDSNSNFIINHDFSNMTCSQNAFYTARYEVEMSYSFVPCNKMYYEGHILQDYLLDGRPEMYEWDNAIDSDVEVFFPSVDENPGNVSVMFSYNFEIPETMTVQVESYIVTFMDLIGVVGGTFSMFVGFAFYDNILSFLDYIIMIWNFIKRISRKRVSKVKNQSSVESQKQNDSKNKPKQLDSGLGQSKPNKLEQGTVSLQMDEKKNKSESEKQISKKPEPTQPKPKQDLIQVKPNQKGANGPSKTKKKVEGKPKTKPIQDNSTKTPKNIKETKPKN